MEVTLADRGDLVPREVLRTPPDVVLLDLKLPGADGHEVCQRLRERVSVPIIMLKARSEETGRVMALEGGADDYMSKPFSTRESWPASGPATPRIRLGALVVDSATMNATLRGARLAPTTHEFALLLVLAERTGRVLSREQRLELVRGARHARRQAVSGPPPEASPHVSGARARRARR